MAGLYIHIPFCMQKCLYCDFSSYAGAEDGIEAYVVALKAEMEALSPLFPDSFSTVFIGGGTPTYLSEQALADILHALHDHFNIDPNAEISMECNPGTADKSKLALCHSLGVNRLSIGLQSADNGLLRRIGRIHDYQAFENVYGAAQKAGFSNINIDVMHGLPGQTQALYLATLQQVCALAPTHISAYSLILEEHTPLYNSVQKGTQRLPSEDETADMQDAGMAYLASQGYSRYEISNFAKPGYQCRHNLNYWQNGAYLGLGAAAHSAWRMDDAWQRWSNPAEIVGYIRAAAVPLSNRVIQRISAAEERFECVMLALRTVQGLELSAFIKRFGVAFADCYPEAIAQLQKQNWLQIKNGYAALTPRGLDMQNAALLPFIPE